MGLIKKIIKYHKEVARKYPENYDRWLVGRIFLGIGVMAMNFYLAGDLLINTQRIDQNTYLEKRDKGRIELIEYESTPLYREKLIDFNGDYIADVKEKTITTIAAGHPVLEGIVKISPVREEEQNKFQEYCQRYIK